MNFLAHLTLSHWSADLQVGNFLGDFVRGRQLEQFSESVQRGILLHRQIDRTTDLDPEVRRVNLLLRSRHGRYAPVITDIIFDHCLYLNWDRFGPAPFSNFCNQSYTHLTAARPTMPDRVADYARRMVEDDWLALYTTQKGMKRVFHRLEPRLSKPYLLDGVNESLVEYADDFNQAFLHLFPSLQLLAATYRD